MDHFEWNFMSRTCLENYEKHAPRVSQVIAAVAKVSCKHGLWLSARVNNKSVRCQLIQLTFSNALKPVAKRIWTSDPSLRRRVLYPAELWRHMPQTLDFTGFLGFFPSAIYKIINSFSSCQSTDFFALVTLERSPIWGMPRLSLRRHLLYSFN